jgi:hypothetical protein
MTVLVLARSQRALAALELLRPVAIVLAVEQDRLPPHELEAARRGLLGRSDRGRRHAHDVEAAFADAARELADELAAQAQAAGFEVEAVHAYHGPRELERLLAGLRPSALVVERRGRHLPPHVRRLLDEAASPVLVV